MRLGRSSPEPASVISAVRTPFCNGREGSRMKSTAELCRHLHCRTYWCDTDRTDRAVARPANTGCGDRRADRKRRGGGEREARRHPADDDIGRRSRNTCRHRIRADSQLVARRCTSRPDSSRGISSRRSGDGRRAGDQACFAGRCRVGSSAYVDRAAQNHLGERWIQDDRVRAAGHARRTGLDVPGPARTRCPVPVARDTDVRRSRLLSQLRGRRLSSDGSPAVGR